MAFKLIKGKINDSGRDFAVSSPTGAETITASIAAGEIGIVMEDTIRLDSITIDTIIADMADTLRELKYVTS